MKIVVIYSLTLLLPVFSVSAQVGKIIQVQVHSKSLEGNLAGDSPDRNVSIYLPPGYDRQLKKRYPVAYLLHGFSGQPLGGNLTWFRGDSSSHKIKVQAINRLIASWKNT